MIDRHAKRRMVSAYKLSRGCSQCGDKELEPHELHMHHLPGSHKVDNVSDLISQDASLSRIWLEIAKCVILCHSCHMSNHHENSETGEHIMEDF